MDSNQQFTMNVLADSEPAAPAEWVKAIFRPDLGQRRLYFLAKRCVDVLGALVLILLFSPLIVIIAVFIKIDTPGPVLFVQERVGSRRRYNNDEYGWAARTFRFYKFRSMVQDADPSLHIAYIRAFTHNRIERSPEARAHFKIANDHRITRVGRILRKTSLDELPQLLNVLKGDMSLVGPRPVPTYEVAEYTPQAWHRFATLPGVTGLWQVDGRSEVPFEEMIRMDLEYVQQQSLWLDLKILLRTIPVVLLGRGAR